VKFHQPRKGQKYDYLMILCGCGSKECSMREEFAVPIRRVYKKNPSPSGATGGGKGGAGRWGPPPRGQAAR